MASAPAPHPQAQNSADLAIDSAVQRVYAKYGADVGAFFRDANRRMHIPSSPSTPDMRVLAARKLPKPA